MHPSMHFSPLPPISLSQMHVHVHEQINAPPQKATLYKAKIKEKGFPFTKAINFHKLRQNAHKRLQASLSKEYSR